MEFNNMRFTAKSGKGPIAGALLRSLGENGELSIPALRSLSPLSDKAQVLVDKAVVEVGLERLQFAADLLAGGLTFPIADPLSVTQLEWETINKVGTAQRTMSPSARGENQLVDRVVHRLPIYLTTDDFSIGIRTLKMAQRVGTPLDMTMIKQAVRRVNESIEDAAINGATTLDGQTLQVNGGYDAQGNAITSTAPGLVNAPNANTGANTVDWTAANVVGTTGPAMVADVLAGITALQADFKYGPYNLYIGTKAGNVINGDYKSAAGPMGTIRARLEEIEAGGRTINVRVADRMPNAATGTQFALVQMTSDVVEMITGQPPTVIPWTSLDGFQLHWLVMAIQIPRVRSDYNGNSGVYLGQKS